METIIAIAVITLILGFSIWYIIKEKKRGTKCIGCPDAHTCSSGGCSGNCSSCSGCQQ